MPKTPSTGTYRFEGFVTPRYTPTPDQLFDELLAPGLLTEAELRVLLYIIRRTFGWKKDQDTISLSQITDGIVRRDGVRLDYGAGVAKSSAVRAIKGLVAKGIIITQRHQSRERGFEATSYALRVREPLSAYETSTQSPLSSDETRESSPLSPDETRSMIPLSPDETRPVALAISEPTHTPVRTQRATRASVKVDQALVAPADTQETANQESAKQETDSDRATPVEWDKPPRYSPYIAGVIMDFSRELGDAPHGPANVTQALRLWSTSGLQEDLFVERLYTARARTRTAQGRQGHGHIGNRMAYFFVVLRDVLNLAAHS